MSKFHRLAVQHLGLDGIDLIEALRRNAEAAAAENVLDIPLAVEYGLFLTEHKIGVEVVDILHDGRDCGELFPDSAHEVVFGGEYGRACYEHQHDLVCLKAAAYQHVAQKALVRVLVVGRQLEGRQQLSHADNDAVGSFVLDHAAVDARHVVGARLIDARDDLSAAVGVECRLHLVAVVKGRFHADDRLHAAEALEKPFGLSLLETQLFGVGGVQLTAAAFFVNGTAVRFCVIHKISPCCFLVLFYH